MYLNIFHRPDSVALYPIFRRQQELAHRLGFKTSVFLGYEHLFDEQIVADTLQDEREFGDEIGLSLHRLTGPKLDELAHTQNNIWLLSRSRKREVLELVLNRFREVFGRLPRSVANYHFDSSALQILRELAPEVKTVVGGCFEEGVRVFHGCNHSWYLFNEGMPWNPWYPSKNHTLRPAASAADASGVVAVAHLMRDMSLSYEGRNDFWASHPPNVIRGMGNDASFCPYDLNLIDQFRMQEDWNGGYSYYNTFVGPSWLTWNHNSEYPPEVAWELYTKQLTYFAELRDRKEVTGLTLAEYGDWHQAHRPIGRPEVYWAKEILYGSGKHYFWFIDPARRVLVDATQGGAIGDLRPYTGQVPVATGPDTPHREIASYPFLIQSQHRTGNAHHAHDGARTTLLLTYGKETLDASFLRSKISAVTRQDDEITVTFSVTQFRFTGGLTGELQTQLTFLSDGRHKIERHISQLSDPAATLTLTEYFKGAPGRTEYAEDLHSIRLYVDGETPCELDYDYEEEVHTSAGAGKVGALIPQTNTRLELAADGAAQSGHIKAGHLFSPYFTLYLDHALQGNGRTTTWMTLTNTKT
jgi:hypothetical protein